MNYFESLPKDYQAFLAVMNEKGGTRKSEFVVQLADVFIRLGLSVRFFEIDDQDRASTLFPDLTTKISLPSTGVLIENDQADIDALDPIFTEFAQPFANVMIVDTGANFDSRVLEAFMLSGTSSLLAERTALYVLVPFLPHAETIMASARTIKLFPVSSNGTE